MRGVSFYLSQYFKFSIFRFVIFNVCGVLYVCLFTISGINMKYKPVDYISDIEDLLNIEDILYVEKIFETQYGIISASFDSIWSTLADLFVIMRKTYKKNRDVE